MRIPTLHSRIRNGALLMLLIALILGAVELPQVYRLGGAIRETLYRNYVSIEAAQHMHAALCNIQLAQREGTLTRELQRNRGIFDRALDRELGDITEKGEAALAADIQSRWRAILSGLKSANGAAVTDARYAELHRLLDRLIAMNKAAMFRANSRASRLSARVTTEFAAGLGLLLVFGVALAWTLSWAISKPLSQLADGLRSLSLRGPSLRLGEQPLGELAAVAQEFNKMAERLEQFEKINVDRLIYEKSKTEAIIENIEDGLVLIDPAGVVTHINETAAVILGVEREEALGSRFDDLSTNQPHYLRVRAALAGAARRPIESESGRIEVDLHVRGRDHTYVLKRLPLRQEAGQSLGTVLILQDITYLRDKDRARTNLVATLSHELKTPLTSLALSAGLLQRDAADFSPRAHELIDSLEEDVGRIRHLADDLLDLARGAGAAITIRSVKLDLVQLIAAVVRTFARQAAQKQVALVSTVAPSMPAVRADPVKLEWAISNLITNALRYTPAGGTITLAAKRDANRVRLSVSDTGPGIAPELRDHLFERYAQWDINGAEAGSAGLGLAIVKEIVEAHGGRIFVSSSPGEGICFTVELPLRAEDAWPGS